jgi:hypothetical protein
MYDRRFAFNSDESEAINRLATNRLLRVDVALIHASAPGHVIEFP